MLPHGELGKAWRDGRAAGRVVHLDAAGNACPSQATFDTVVGHLRREVEIGGYAAETEAAERIEEARAAIGRLVGLPPAGVSFTVNTSKALADLLSAWPLPEGARIGVLASDFATNRSFVDVLAARRGVVPVPLPADAWGRADLDGVADALDEGLSLVVVPHVASHRGVVQPASGIAAMCRERGAATVVDAAQSAGQVDLAGIGADAWVAPSRKWLRGPRGVGFVAVAEPWRSRLDAPLEAKEGPIAARLGFGAALVGLEAAGADRVAERIAALGSLARRRLDGLEGWRVGEPLDEPSGLVTLRHPGHDPLDVQRRLFAAGVLTSAVGDAADMEGFALRAAFHAYADESDLEALVTALTEL